MSTENVYMLNNDSTRGTLQVAGHIYPLESHVAEDFVKRGVAVKVDYPKLSGIDSKIEGIAESLKEEFSRIDDDHRLSDEGKREKKQEILQEGKEQIKGLGEQYEKELQELKQKAMKEASESNREKDYDADKINENVGLIKSDVAMSASFTQGLEAVQRKLPFMDQATARRLLSQFSEIKAELDAKGAGINGANRYISSLYDDVKEAATDEHQAKANVEYRVLETLETSRKYSGHYPPNFGFIEKRV